MTRSNLSRRVSGVAPRRSCLTGARTYLPRKVLPKVTDRQVAQEFRPVVMRFKAKTLAAAADRGPDAVKWWRQGASAPSLASTINMAREIPSVREWLLDMIGEEAEFDSPRAIHETLRARRTPPTGEG